MAPTNVPTDMYSLRVFSTNLVLIAGALTAVACTSDPEDCRNTQTCPYSDGDADATGGTGGNEQETGTGGKGAGGGDSCEADGSCVECTDDSECSDDTALCSDAGECVACLSNTDCTAADASVCEAGACGGCAVDSDCAHIDDAKLCTSGACVECTVADESACGGNSCDPATNTCTETPVGTVKSCESCVADSECETDYRCVLTEFQDAPVPGGVCLKVHSTGCARPFGTQTPPRASLSGAVPEVYCGIDEALTTCAAVLAVDDVCMDDDDCGEQMVGGRCETVDGFTNVCSYSCKLPRDCPGSLDCDGPTDDNKWCGGS